MNIELHNIADTVNYHKTKTDTLRLNMKKIKNFALKKKI